ncbi:MAG: urea transporter [Flavobacteriaceae bacterium]
MNSYNSNTLLKIYGNGLLNSYSQIFFSNNKTFAVLLLIISFFDLGAGLSGVLSVIICQVTAKLFNFNEELIRDGSYTYNALMVGIALGMFYDFNFSFFVILVIISILTLFITIWFITVLAKKGLPFLSLPFLFGIWIIILGAPNFSALQLNPKEILSLAKWFPELFSSVTNSIGSLPFADVIHLYFRSLGAIFFQYNDLAGLIIAIGILIYSRIAFGLSIVGFSIGFAFYHFFGGDFSQLIYSYIGFNFILTAIALGGFFVVPSKKSYLMLFFIIPVIALSISSLHTLFTYFNLPLYSLPFNIITIIFLATMATRRKDSGIALVTLQQFSPEKNHYKHLNSVNRFKNNTYYHLNLPVMGNWHISQGHNGGITHKEDWQYAWDFDVLDEDEKSYQFPGIELKDYYCYDLPVIAPSEGYVVEIFDGIEDNKINEVNLKENWGNTIIIKHGEHFYTKLSHIKKGSFKVKKGDYVTKGQLLGSCGSSGRSPEPHLHFQLQTTPYIDSKTIEFPLAYYLQKEKNKYHFHCFDIPKENETVLNVKTTKLITEAFDFVPGKTFYFNYKGETVKWEVFTNAINQTYIYCHESKSTAYFINNGTVFYFTDYFGEDNSLLHHFYYGAQKVLLGYYKDIQLKDELMIDGFFNKFITSFHDFTAPFFHYCKVKYHFSFNTCDNEHNPTEISFQTSCIATIGKKEYKKVTYSFLLKEGKIHSFTINNNQTALCEI